MAQTTEPPPIRRVEHSELTTVAEQSGASITPPSSTEHTEQVTHTPAGVEHHERSTTDDAGLHGCPNIAGSIGRRGELLSQWGRWLAGPAFGADPNGPAARARRLE